MKIILFFSLFLTSVYSTTITNHNIYKQQDSVDLMLTFDEPYLGKISKKVENKSTILMLENIKLDESITKKIDSKIIQKFQILPYKNQIFIKVDAKTPYTIEASKTVDNFGLRIRIKPQTLQTLNRPQQTKFETKKDEDISGSFVKIIAILTFLILLLYLLKRWMENNQTQSSSWLFSKENSKKQPIKIINQKIIDTKNKITVIEYGEMSYLVILGTNPILLDKFKTGEKNQKEQFDKLLSENTNKLDTLLQK